MGLVGSAATSFAADCASDPNECTPRSLCEVATEVKDGLKLWSTTLTSNKHVSFAQELGMNCGVVELKDPCDTDPNECKIKQLCEKATIDKDGTKSWNSEAEAYAVVAKEYGLNCEVNEKRHCNTHLDECTPDQLCARSTYTDPTINKKVWQNSSKKFVQEAKRRGLDCGVTADAKEAIITLKTSDVCTHSEFKGCNALELCERATWGKNATFWYSDTNNFVIEAKRRGLDCGVTDLKVALNCEDNPTTCTDDKLCIWATSGSSYNVWTKSLNHQIHIVEAKSRGLSCGVTNMVTSSAKKCSVLDKDNTSECSDESICLLATNGYHGNKNWTKIGRYLTFVSEAKQRGLNCKVEEKKATTPKAKTPSAIKLKQYFTSKSKLERQQIQYALKNLGYYKSGVDGIWGPKTKAALSGFVSKENVKLKSILFVLSEMVNIPSSFSSQKKIASKSCSLKNFAACDDENFCRIATYNPGIVQFWNYDVGQEAKRRGLECGVDSRLISNKKENEMNDVGKELLKLGIIGIGCALTPNPAACLEGASGSSGSSSSRSTSNSRATTIINNGSSPSRSTSSSRPTNIINNSGCSSDFQCSMGEKCVKKPYSNNGVCMKTVNRYGVQTYSTPSASSVRPRMGGKQCRFLTDCPIGFQCDMTYNVCVK